MTQEELADRMQDVHRELHPDESPDRTRGQMVSDWERAVNEPSPAKLELLAAALMWTVGDLNADEPDRSSGTPDLVAELGDGDETVAATLARIAEKLDAVSNRVDRLLEEAGLELDGSPEDPVASLEADEEAAAQRSGSSGERSAASKRASQS